MPDSLRRRWFSKETTIAKKKACSEKTPPLAQGSTVLLYRIPGYQCVCPMRYGLSLTRCREQHERVSIYLSIYLFVFPVTREP